MAIAALDEEDMDKHREILLSFFDDLANDGEEPIADNKACFVA